MTQTLKARNAAVEDWNSVPSTLSGGSPMPVTKANVRCFNEHPRIHPPLHPTHITRSDRRKVKNLNQSEEVHTGVFGGSQGKIRGTITL